MEPVAYITFHGRPLQSEVKFSRSGDLRNNQFFPNDLQASFVPSLLKSRLTRLDAEIATLYKCWSGVGIACWSRSTSRRARLVMGWVTMSGLVSSARHLSRYVTSHTGQLSLPSLLGRKWGQAENRAGLTIRGPHTNVMRGPFSRTRSQDFLICGGALFSQKKLTTFFRMYAGV